MVGRYPRHPDRGDWYAQQATPAIRIAAGPGYSLTLGNPVTVTMFLRCWIVKMTSAYENAEEEAKWLVDVMVSLLRLYYVGSFIHFPKLGDVEPHPLKPTETNSLGIKIEGTKAETGGSKMPPAYALNLATRAGIETPVFEKKADILCSPPPRSVAERVSQGLGWMTRGRQASDRSERLLFFFTAIEALLSSDDKSAPVVQTIARHAAVIVTNDNSTRAAVAANIKSLYGIRSSLVHAGARSVLHANANQAQALAENLFMRVLDNVDLGSRHSAFVQELADASYGSPWH